MENQNTPRQNALPFKQVEDRYNYDAAKAAAGKKGGEIGGPARAKALSAEERSSIAHKAAVARWGK